tara:strand:+ start:66 stop:941 length:876 start_codon:yes stop_codon:yes gene_type:complete
MTVENPFSQNFQEEFRQLQEAVRILTANIGEDKRSFGQMFDRLGGRAEQYILFCDVISGRLKGEQQNEETEDNEPVNPEGDGDGGIPPIDPPDGGDDPDLPPDYPDDPDAPGGQYRRRSDSEDEDEESGRYVITPAFDFYQDILELEEDEEVPFAQLFRRLKVPPFVRKAFSDEGKVVAKNSCDFRYKKQEPEGERMRNLHGVFAPNNTDETEIPGNVVVQPLRPSGEDNGIGAVPVVFTRIGSKTHIGIYGKNDLEVSCSTLGATEESAARMRVANKRWRGLRAFEVGKR